MGTTTAGLPPRLHVEGARLKHRSAMRGADPTDLFVVCTTTFIVVREACLKWARMPGIHTRIPHVSLSWKDSEGADKICLSLRRWTLQLLLAPSYNSTAADGGAQVQGTAMSSFRTESIGNSIFSATGSGF